MEKNISFVGLDVHMKSISVAVAEGGEPALAAEADHLWADDQLLHDEVLVARERANRPAPRP